MFNFNVRKVVRLETRVKELTQQVVQLMEMRDDLNDQTAVLTSENKKLKITRDMEDEQIAHKLKMREETCDMEYNKKLIKKDETCAKAVADVKDNYRDKVEKQLEKRGAKLRSELNSRFDKVEMPKVEMPEFDNVVEDFKSQISKVQDQVEDVVETVKEKLTPAKAA